jgi:hypothetical protein
MQVGIVSDTHDNLDVAEAAVDRFTEAGVDAVVHCGDVVAPFTARVFDTDAFDFYTVRGNNDGEWGLQSMVEGFGVYLGEFGELALEGTRVAVYHGTSEGIIGALVECDSYDYVLHGHTHERVEYTQGGTTRINPGGIPTEPTGGEPPAAVVLDTDGGETKWYDLA